MLDNPKNQPGFLSGFLLWFFGFFKVGFFGFYGIFGFFSFLSILCLKTVFNHVIPRSTVTWGITIPKSTFLGHLYYLVEKPKKPAWVFCIQRHHLFFRFFGRTSHIEAAGWPDTPCRLLGIKSYRRKNVFIILENEKQKTQKTTVGFLGFLGLMGFMGFLKNQPGFSNTACLRMKKYKNSISFAKKLGFELRHFQLLQA